MKKNIDAIESFHHFAKEKLKNHFEELKSRLIKGIRKIYSRELEEKIQALAGNEETPWLKGELENLKHTYIAKLKLNNP